MLKAIFMNQIEHYLHPSSLDLVEVCGLDQMAAYLRAPYHPTHRYIESLATASAFGHLDFWFTFWPGPVPRDVNRPATELLLAVTEFGARTVPLLRGPVMITSHDSEGGLAALTDEQITQVALHANRWRGRMALEWRYAVDARAQRRRRKVARAAQERALWDRLSNSARLTGF